MRISWSCSLESKSSTPAICGGIVWCGCSKIARPARLAYVLAATCDMRLPALPAAAPLAAARAVVHSLQLGVPQQLHLSSVAGNRRWWGQPLQGRRDVQTTARLRASGATHLARSTQEGRPINTKYLLPLIEARRGARARHTAAFRRHPQARSCCQGVRHSAARRADLLRKRHVHHKCET